MRSPRSTRRTGPRRGRRPTAWARTVLVATAAATFLTGAGTAVGDPGTGGTAPAGTPNDGSDRVFAPTAAAAEPVTVTLISGDRVTVRPVHGRPGVTVEPAKERRGKGITFRRFSVDDHLYVVPSDLADQVAAGRLDRRLFDVTGLIELGYDDRHRDDLPLIVAYGSGDARTLNALEGAEVTRPLPVIGGAAVSLDKAAAGAAARSLLAEASVRSNGSLEHIWLDGKAQVLLDQSVPQIGAPPAWESGFTGEGVTVAVLDTGVDASHPDLDDAVTAAQDFTGEGPEDANGHGTHVASTITGSGEASGGTYKGVAPDADLVSGKVCDAAGDCDESWILAGMEWAAVEQDADIINLSLGGLDTPGTDPLEAAVDELTERTGALFVVAAGNEGPAPRSLNSPASADAALAVGAVDRSDQVPAFSSRGPRTGDGGPKPDITAPGVGIVAARAEGTEIGDPVGDAYVTSTGTSMATPHVAGAAALLAQQHPEWTAADLKAALMGSAEPNPEWSVFDQGAGRVDVARAIGQEVFADQGSLSFGRRLWPHDDDEPVTKRLTYRNTGDSDVTVELSVGLADPDGAPAPEGAASLSKESLTIPAGGTASVDVTLDTRHDGPDGIYTGKVTATGPVELVTPLSIEKEVESYDLTIRSIDRNGDPAPVDAAVVGHADLRTEEAYDEDGTTTIRLPKGDYLVDSFVTTDPEGEASLSHVVQPRLTLDRDLTWTADARKARPFSVALDREDASVALADIGYAAQIAGAEIGRGIWAFSLDGVFAGQVGPADDSLTALFTGQWGRQSDDGSFAGSPYAYTLADRRAGAYWNGYDEDVRDEDLAHIRTSYAEQSDREVEDYMFGWLTGGAWASSMGWRFDPPATVDVFLSPGDHVRWTREVEEVSEDDEGFPVEVTGVESPETSYEAGDYRERWNTAVFGPSLSGDEPWAMRFGDRLAIGVPMYADGEGHLGWSTVDAASTVLYREGTKIAESEEPGLLEAGGLPDEEAEYVMEVRADRRSVSDLSGRQTVRWTFRSGAADGTVALPLWAVRFAPRVDGENVGQDRPVTLVPVALEANPGAEVGDVERPVVAFSVGDGWRKAPLIPAGDGSWLAVVRTGDASGHVSLRATVEDSNGNRVEQTVRNAFRLG